MWELTENFFRVLNFYDLLPFTLAPANWWWWETHVWSRMRKEIGYICKRSSFTTRMVSCRRVRMSFVVVELRGLFRIDLTSVFEGRWLSSGLLRRIVWWKFTDVSEVLTALIIRALSPYSPSWEHKISQCILTSYRMSRHLWIPYHSRNDQDDRGNPCFESDVISV
jgi:hypothetical protein